MSAPRLRRVAIARTDLLGELVLTLTLARQLRSAEPPVDVTMVVAPRMKELMALCPDVGGVITHQVRRDGAWWLRSAALARVLRRGRYDTIVIANPTKEVHAAAWLSGIPVRIGYDCKGGKSFLTHVFPDERPVFSKHETQWNSDLLGMLGMSGPAPAPRLSIDRMPRDAAERRWAEWGLVPGQAVIAVHPWASQPYKRWPRMRFLALAHRLAALEGVRVAVIGGAEHAEESREFNSTLLNLTGRTSLSDLALLISRSLCLVSNDTGPVHVAAALGCPAVVLFGTEDPVRGPRRWGPWGDGHTVIWKHSMIAIEEEEVFDAVRPYLPKSACVTSAAS